MIRGGASLGEIRDDVMKANFEAVSGNSAPSGAEAACLFGLFAEVSTLPAAAAVRRRPAPPALGNGRRGLIAAHRRYETLMFRFALAIPKVSHAVLG
jgi:hypothetical protein